MGTVSVSLPSDGTTADVADYNTPITTLVNEFNGNIDNANIKTAAAIDGAKLADSTITAAKLSTSAIKLGRKDVTNNIVVTTIGSDITLAMDTTVTVPAGSRDVEVVLDIPFLSCTGGTVAVIKIWTGSIGGTLIKQHQIKLQDSGDQKPVHMSVQHTPSSGSLAYLVSLQTTVNNVTANCAATYPAQLLLRNV